MSALIAIKLVEIMKECSYVQKLGKNSFHNYKYAMASDVLEKVNDSLSKHGIATIVIPEMIEFRDVTTAKGNLEHLATIKVTIRLIDSESGESLELIGLGSGQDAGDKAIMKAQTAALKYAWMMSLQISTGDDPEADTSTDESTAPATSKPTAKSSQNNNQSKPQSKNQAQAQSKPLNEAQIKRFYSISQGKTNKEIISMIMDDQVPNRRLDGKFNWNAVSRAEYDQLCHLFETDEWQEVYQEIMDKELLAG